MGKRTLYMSALQPDAIIGNSGHIYSGTPLKQIPLGPKNLSFITRYP